MVYLIAEIGFNHGGDLGLACEMILAAARSGADGVKFQSFRAKDLYFHDRPEYAIFEAGELSVSDHAVLKERCDDSGVDFLSAPFSLDCTKMLDRLDVSRFKIASMDLNNRELIAAVAATGRPVILSTGGGTFDEIGQAVDWLEAGGAGEITILHCVSNYPTLPEESSLWMIPALIQKFGGRVGFSDHTIGVTVPAAAVALGARAIEKHFTTDKTLPGPDHAMAADPDEFLHLRHVVDAMEIAMRQEDQRRDAAKRPVMRRGVYAARPIAEGELVTRDHIVLVRPEITPLELLDSIIGKPATKSYQPGCPL